MGKGDVYTIERGSYVGQQRKQLSRLAVAILRPEIRPLSPVIKGAPVADDESIHRYFEDYLINPDVGPNEVYTYSSRLAPHLEYIATMLRETPNTNQATIEIGRPEDVYLDDPPCLRVVSWKVLPIGLQMSVFFRSWDLHTGFPTNVGGLQLLNEMMAEWVGLDSGYLVLYSDGAHLYDHSWGMFE
jgi:thymidylate synthase